MAFKAIQPVALEAETREKILKESDDAIYLRRNSSVEQERKIKENELNTEIAVENKKKQIKEAIKEVFASETYEAGFEKFKTATALLDRLSLRGILHKNTAANRKSSMARFLNSLKTANNN